MTRKVHTKRVEPSIVKTNRPADNKTMGVAHLLIHCECSTGLKGWKNVWIYEVSQLASNGAIVLVSMILHIRGDGLAKQIGLNAVRPGGLPQQKPRKKKAPEVAHGGKIIACAA